MVRPYHFSGPFNGLATTLDPREPGPGYATRAHNVLLGDGRVTPRPPWVRYTFEGAYGDPDWPLTDEDRILSGVPWTTPQGVELILLKVARGIGYDNGSLWLQDAGSRNGVFVNGVRVTAHQALKVGDEITIADHVFTVRWDADEEISEVRPVTTEETAQPPRKKRWFWPF